MSGVAQSRDPAPPTNRDHRRARSALTQTPAGGHLCCILGCMETDHMRRQCRPRGDHFVTGGRPARQLFGRDAYQARRYPCGAAPVGRLVAHRAKESHVLAQGSATPRPTTTVTSRADERRSGLVGAQVAPRLPGRSLAGLVTHAKAHGLLRMGTRAPVLGSAPNLGRPVSVPAAVSWQGEGRDTDPHPLTRGCKRGSTEGAVAMAAGGV